MCERITLSTPECDKMRAARDTSQAIGSFLDWLEHETDMVVCYFEDSRDEYLPVRKTIKQLLADYFEIDLNKVEEEKRALLELQRELNKSHDLLEVLG